MTCTEVQPLLSAYHDHELEPVQMRAVAGHLAACSVCRAELRRLATLSELLRSGRDCRIPVDLWERIASAAQRSRRARSRHRWLVRCGGAAAGFALYLAGHNVVATPVWRGEPQPMAATRVEQALRETALALAGPGLADDQFAALGARPELQVLQELTEGVEP